MAQIFATLSPDFSPPGFWFTATRPRQLARPLRIHTASKFLSRATMLQSCAPMRAAQGQHIAYGDNHVFRQRSLLQITYSRCHRITDIIKPPRSVTSRQILTWTRNLQAVVIQHSRRSYESFLPSSGATRHMQFSLVTGDTSKFSELPGARKSRHFHPIRQRITRGSFHFYQISHARIRLGLNLNFFEMHASTAPSR